MTRRYSQIEDAAIVRITEDVRRDLKAQVASEGSNGLVLFGDAPSPVDDMCAAKINDVIRSAAQLGLSSDEKLLVLGRAMWLAVQESIDLHAEEAAKDNARVAKAMRDIQMDEAEMLA